MQITNVRFTNYRQHVSSEFELRPGVSGVVGPNGSGKSNLIRGIQYLLTGAFPRVAGSDGLVPIAQNISWGYEKGEIECKFIHNGIAGSIRRALHASSCQLLYGTDVKLRKAAEVNAFISSMMGTSSRIIGQYVFTHQNDTTAVLRAKSSERAQMFSVLFNTDRCEQIRELLADELKNQAPSDLSFSSTLLIDTINSTEAKLRELNTTAASLHSQMAGINEPVERQQLIAAKANADAYSHPSTGFAATEATLLSLSQQINNWRMTIQDLKERQQTQLLAVKGSEDQLVHHRSLIQQATQVGNLRLRRNELLIRVKDFQNAIESHQRARPSVPTIDEAQVQMYREQLAAVKMDLTTNQRLVANLSGGSGTCPTCGTHHVTDANGTLKSLSDLLHTAQQKVAELQPWTTQTLEWLQQQDTLKRTSEQKLNAWVTQEQKLQSALQAAEAGLSELPDVPEIDAAQSQAFMQHYQAAQEQLQVIGKQVDQAVNSLNHVEAAYTQQSQHLERLKTLQLVDYSETEKRLKTWDECHGKVMTLGGQMTELDRILIASKNQLERLRQAEQRSETIRTYRDTLSTVIGVLHRDGYPSAVARLHFATINHAWNQALQLLGQPYQARVLPDQTIQLQFSKGLAEFHEASGGQQCCAAIAYLWAANQQFASEAGMMFLDEPTNGIDADHIPMVADMLLNMQKAALSANLQVVVVTHDERLMRGCNHVVQLGR